MKHSIAHLQNAGCIKDCVETWSHFDNLQLCFQILRVANKVCYYDLVKSTVCKNVKMIVVYKVEKHRIIFVTFQNKQIECYYSMLQL
jgi:hypothetical protein